MKDTLTICLPFSGFYESMHSEAIDNAETSAMDFDGRGYVWTGMTEEEVTLCREHTTWRVAFETYAKAYADGFARLLESEYGLTLKSLSFVELDSPRFYNYSTDRIFCTISVEDANLLRQSVSQTSLRAALDYLFTPCDGYAPFYSRDVVEWEDTPTEELDHNHLHAYLLAYLAEYNGKGVDDAEIATEWEVYEAINGQSPSAADTAYDAAIDGEAIATLNRVRERYENELGQA